VCGESTHTFTLFLHICGATVWVFYGKFAFFDLFLAFFANFTTIKKLFQKSKWVHHPRTIRHLCAKFDILMLSQSWEIVWRINSHPPRQWHPAYFAIHELYSVVWPCQQHCNSLVVVQCTTCTKQKFLDFFGWMFCSESCTYVSCCEDLFIAVLYLSCVYHSASLPMHCVLYYCWLLKLN